MTNPHQAPETDDDTRVVLTPVQQQALKRQLDESEALHHKIMAKLTDPRFDLLEIWERKARLDAAIGVFIRNALGR